MGLYDRDYMRAQQTRGASAQQSPVQRSTSARATNSSVNSLAICVGTLVVVVFLGGIGYAAVNFLAYALAWIGGSGGPPMWVGLIGGLFLTIVLGYFPNGATAIPLAAPILAVMICGYCIAMQSTGYGATYLLDEWLSHENQTSSGSGAPIYQGFASITPWWIIFVGLIVAIVVGCLSAEAVPGLLYLSIPTSFACVAFGFVKLFLWIGII